MSAVRLVLCSLALATALASHAQSASTDAATQQQTPAYVAARAKWQKELNAFDAADRERLPAAGGVLFVGSSTIRMWPHIAQDFPQQPVVINRGFGGSTMEDASLFARDLVVRYKPRLVLVYAGDNDLAENRTPMQVLESFARFANTVRGELPDTRIAYISIKPSPSREKLTAQMREANNAIAAYLRRMPNTEFIDVYTPMLGNDGRPRPELFRADQLHMTDEGYRLWQSVIASHLAEPATRVDASVTQGLH
ncbi:SGNH/GDSL hydrolase family protein [Variovorax ureilyticus]|uniref:SGNH/GDSL hydrolase family protein n=1 Tax=Variovorax ureilyticus TaxID=1836198 RepID=UPI003D66CAE6